MARLLLLALVLVGFLGEIEAWDQPDFCHNNPCPEYSITANYQDFEERHYVETSWITIKVNGNSPTAFMAAEAVLKDYRQNNQIGESWPLLVYRENNQNYLAWFVPPGSQFHTVDLNVEMRVFPERSIFVRNFSDQQKDKNTSYADYIRGVEMRLVEELAKAGLSFQHQQYLVAFYQHFLPHSSSPYDEAWVPSA